MKIGIDISQIVYQGTGVAQYTQSLVSELLKQNIKDEYFLFGSSLRQKNRLSDFVSHLSGVHPKTIIAPFPLSFLSLLWNRLHIGAIEQFIGPVDVFHSSDWTQPPTQHAKKVTTIHDLIVFRHPEFFPKTIIETQKKRLYWVARECDAIIVDSKATKKDCMTYLSIHENKIHVVPLGVSKQFRPRTKEAIESACQKYSIKGSYILSVGTLEPRKNLGRVISSFNKIKKNIPHRLVVAGNKGWNPNDIEENDKIDEIGYVDSADLPLLYAGASCFVYPSLYEGFGLPVLEALACGCPVVCSLRGSLSEIANGFVVEIDPMDEKSIDEGLLQALFLSEKKKEEFKQRGIKYAQTFSWQKTAKKTFDVYKHVVNL